MPEDPNADPVKLLRKNTAVRRENLKSKKSGPKKDPPKRKKGPAKTPASTSNLAAQVKPPYNDEHFKEIKMYCEWHCSAEEVAQAFGITVQTLDKHCKQYYGYTFFQIYKQYSAGGKRSLRRAMWAKAVNEGDTRLQIYLSKNHLGMSEDPQPEGDDDITHSSKIGVSGEVVTQISSGEDIDKVETFDPSHILLENKTVDTTVEEVEKVEE
jgi:hypothetical protein